MACFDELKNEGLTGKVGVMYDIVCMHDDSFKVKTISETKIIKGTCTDIACIEKLSGRQ